MDSPSEGWPNHGGAMAGRLRSHDWSGSLGAPSGWPPFLRASVDLILPAPMPMGLIWGSDNVLIYNDPFRDLIGPYDPAGFGQPLSGSAPEWLRPDHPSLASARRGASDLRAGVAAGARTVTVGLSPLHDPASSDFAGVLAVAADAAPPSARDDLAAEVGELREKLRHQVRNVLAVVRSITARTARSSETVEDFDMHLRGRIDALARSHAASLRCRDGSVDLSVLISDEILATVGRLDGRVVILGPEARLSSTAAASLGMAVHELATNAVKFGALATAGGKLTVEWSIDAATSTLALAWAEAGPGPAPGQDRHGVGSEVVDRTLPYELGARTSRTFTAQGIRCLIEVPLTARNLPG